MNPDPDLFSPVVGVPVFEIIHRLLECVFVIFASLAYPKENLDRVITSVSQDLDVVRGLTNYISVVAV